MADISCGANEAKPLALFESAALKCPAACAGGLAQEVVINWLVDIGIRKDPEGPIGKINWLSFEPTIYREVKNFSKLEEESKVRCIYCVHSYLFMAFI